MAAIIVAGAYLGTYLDEKFENASPWLLVSTLLIAVFLAIYVVIKEVMKQSDEE